MNLEEARKVIWLKNKPRPMGELLDEGYLDQFRLEWATEKAFRPELKEAAGVILAWKKSAVSEIKAEEKAAKGMDVGIAVDKARSIMWPFSPFKGQTIGCAGYLAHPPVFGDFWQKFSPGILLFRPGWSQFIL